MKNTKRDFNGAAHFFLGLSLACVAMTIVSNSINISNYNYFGWNSSILIKEIVIDALILGAGVLTFMKKKSGLIALVILFIVRMFVTIPWNSDTSTAYLLGGKTADLFRDFAPFAIAMCFKKNGISGWKSMLASEEYVIAHTIMKERIDEPIDEQTVDESSPNGQDDEQHKPKEESEVFQPTIVENEQDQGAGIEAHVEEKPQVAAFPVSDEKIEEEKNTLTRPKTSLSKVAKVCIASIIGIIAVCAGIAVIIATKSYPDYISSFGDKWKYTFNLPNDKLVKKIMDGIHGDNPDGYIIVEFSDGDVIGYTKEYYFDNRIDIHREWHPIQIHSTIREIPNPNDIKIGKEYAVADSEHENWKIIPKDEADELKDEWLNDIKEPGAVVKKVYEVVLYEYEASLKKEMSIADIAATIPVKSVDVMDEVGGYYYNEENYSKAADYYRFLLKKNPRDPAIKGRLALSLTRGGDYEDARVFAEEAIKKDSKELTALSALALIEAENYNWGEVKKWAKKAIDYGSENSNVYYAYCEALYKQGEIKASHEYYNKAFELYRNNPRREKFTEYAGCPFEIQAFHYIAFKTSQSGSTILIPKDEKLVRSKCYYVGFEFDATFFRYDEARIGIKLFENNKLLTGLTSQDGYTYFATVDRKEPGKVTFNVGGWGNNSGSSWAAGRHRIELWYKDEKIAEDTFQIY